MDLAASSHICMLWYSMIPFDAVASYIDLQSQLLAFGRQVVSNCVMTLRLLLLCDTELLQMYR